VLTPDQSWSHDEVRLAALRHHRAGRFEEADALYRRALAIEEDDPDVLHMLGMVLYTFEKYREALPLVRRAGELSRWALPAIKHNLGLILGALLAGRNAAAAARFRTAYAAWVSARNAPGKPVHPLVSVVVPSHNHARYVAAALDSVFRQTYRDIELIVIDDGSDDGSPEIVREVLLRCPFPCALIARENRGAPATINEGVRLARGEYINVLNSDDCFEPARVDAMVRAVGGAGADWGFSAVSCIDAVGDPLGDIADARAAWIARAGDQILQSDTVGCALLGENNVAISSGNLFFAKTLFERLEGFRNYRCNHDWDFCLRALWQSEPSFVPGALYRYRLHATNTIRGSTHGARVEALRIMSDYHSIAAAEEPINPFAPSRHTLGLRYGVDQLVLGGGGAFPQSALIELADELGSSRAIVAGARTDLLSGGLNVIGYVRGEFGLGVSVRALASACMAHDVPVCLQDAGLKLGSRQAERSMDMHLSDELRYRNTLIYMNPDQLKAFWSRSGNPGSESQRRIGYWYWELERLPRKWLYALDLVDEVWVASDFVRAAVAGATGKPVIKIPHSINVRPSRTYRRLEFGLPEQAFLFLFAFDFNSYMKRKNPEAAILAFRKAFPSGSEDVRLVLKCAHGHVHSAEVAALRRLIGSDPRVLVLDKLLARDTLHGLQSVCDAYVSLHRSEGLGLGMAECMALEKPVIATAYSGNLEFMHEGNSCLVDFRLVPVRPGDYIEYEDQWHWADADIGHAAFFMRKVVADSDFRTRIARQARQDIETRFNEAATASAIRKRLAEIETLQAPVAGSP
jgi:glycosyltransferase involved in cell wall biosynthesis